MRSPPNQRLQYRVLDREDRVRWVEDHTTYTTNGDGCSGDYYTLLIDITETHQIESSLNYQATHDPLTGLHNRLAFEREVERALERCRSAGLRHTLCYIDLDQFKVVNDTCGHEAGDELLRQLALTLNECVRSNDTLARLGGDEFGLLLESCPTSAGIKAASELMSAIRNFRFEWKGLSFNVGASIGLTELHDETSSVREGLSRADMACFCAKEAGRDRIHCHEERTTTTTSNAVNGQWEKLKQRIEEHQFELYCQPIVSSRDPKSTPVYELLLRMRDEQGRLSPPSAFFPPAERHNLTSAIDRWVVEEAIGWLEGRPPEERAGLSINLSAGAVSDAHFQEWLLERLGQTECRTLLCFEIRETVAVVNLSRIQTLSQRLAELGCRVALDDFGSGLSSLHYLRKLPVHYVKINGDIIRDMLDNPVDHVLVRSMNDIAHMIDIQTIAEFVENERQQNVLTSLGVDFLQGFHLARPFPLHQLKVCKQPCAG